MIPITDISTISIPEGKEYAFSVQRISKMKLKEILTKAKNKAISYIRDKELTRKVAKELEIPLRISKKPIKIEASAYYIVVKENSEGEIEYYEVLVLYPSKHYRGITFNYGISI